MTFSSNTDMVEWDTRYFDMVDEHSEEGASPSNVNVYSSPVKNDASILRSDKGAVKDIDGFKAELSRLLDIKHRSKPSKLQSNIVSPKKLSMGSIKNSKSEQPVKKQQNMAFEESKGERERMPRCQLASILYKGMSETRQGNQLLISETINMSSTKILGILHQQFVQNKEQ